MDELLTLRPTWSSSHNTSEIRVRLRSAHRQSVLFLLLLADPSTVEEVVPELLTALLRQRDTALVQRILLGLSERSREVLWSAMSARLPGADDEEYRRYAELLTSLGAYEKLQQLVALALIHDDEHVREVGEDYGKR